MPTRNRRRFLPRSIQMFLNQVMIGSAELLIIEDGDEIQQGKIKTDGSIYRYYHLEGTIGEKLNKGARLARGKYLINWDDDDFQHRDRISNVVRHFELTGAQMVGMSSMPYWREGDETVWVYHSGDARYCTGSGQAFRRDWALANPHPDQSVGADEAICRIAAQQGVLSTISGTDWVVACTHDSHCSDRNSAEEAKLEAIFGRRADNWQKSSIDKFSWVQQWAFQASA